MPMRAAAGMAMNGAVAEAMPVPAAMPMPMDALKKDERLLDDRKALQDFLKKCP